MVKPGTSDKLQKPMAYALMHVCQFLQQEHHRDYVLFTELHRCVSDIMRQIQLDKDNEKEIGTSIEPEKYRKLYNLFGTDAHRLRMRVMRITRGEEELQV